MDPKEKFENELKYIAEQVYRRYGIGKNPGKVKKKDNVYFKLIDYMFENTKDIKIYFPKEIYKDTDLSDFLEILSSIDYEYTNDNDEDYYHCALSLAGTNGKNDIGYYIYFDSIFHDIANLSVNNMCDFARRILEKGPFLEMRVHETITIEVEPGTELYKLMKKIDEERELEDEI